MKLETIIREALVGLIVSFVALSLGASLGILSGRGAFVGMLSAGIIAVITSALGGTRVQCSGPTAPMSAVSATVVAFAVGKLADQASHVIPDHFINTVFILTGIFLLIMAILRVGRFILLVPNVVISGFMNGIAVLIWLSQLKKIFGIGETIPFSGSTWLNLIVVLATLAVIFTFPKISQKLFPKIAHFLSPTLMSIVLVTALVHLSGISIEFVSLRTEIHSLGDFLQFVNGQFPTDLSLTILIIALPFALQLAMLCYLDTLLTSLVVDKMTKEKTLQNKELMAQGIANSTVGLLGGIPGAQATIRSVLMIKEGATLRLAGILVGVFVLIEMVLFQDFISLIPEAVFAGILFKVGYDVFDWLPMRLYFKELYKETSKLLHDFFSRHDDEPIYVTNREMLMIVGTTLVTVFFDLNIAVISFTLLFYLVNKVISPNNPIRDLAVDIETTRLPKEN
jgi:SulP family sulfate permease